MINVRVKGGTVMKRKTELILAWIANGLSSLYLLFVIIGYFAMKSGSGASQNKEMVNQMMGGNQEMSMEMLTTSIALSMGVLAFSTILGIVGALTVKGRNKLGASLLIAAAVVGIMATNIIAIILWFIAGIMLLTKSNQQRPKRDQTVHNHQEDYSKRNEWDPEKELKEHQQKDKPYTY